MIRLARHDNSSNATGQMSNRDVEIFLHYSELVFVSEGLPKSSSSMIPVLVEVFEKGEFLKCT